MTQEPNRIGGMIKRISEQMEKKANKELMAEDVTFSQMKMLVVLEHSPERAATLKELERFFDLTQATIAGLAARLEKKGLVEGYTDPDDRRVKHIRLTEKGYELCKRTRSNMMEAEYWLMHSLDEDEQKELLRLLEKIYENLRTCS